MSKLMSKKTSSNKQPNIEDIYVKKDQREHVLDIPDTYIGSVEMDQRSMYVYDEETNKIINKTINYVPGFFKTCDELIVNARDHHIRENTCNIIKVNIDQETGEFTVWNNGPGIPVEIHKEHDIYIPELIFGNLLTSSNYDQKGKTVGGKNGVGSTCVSSNTIVQLFDGTNIKANEINVNDKLIGDDGNERTVLSVSTGTGQMYRIYQQYGESYDVNDKHILSLFDTKYNELKYYPANRQFCLKRWNNRTKRFENTFYKKYSDFKVNENDDCIVDISIRDIMNMDSDSRSRFHGFRNKAINWSRNDNIDTDPFEFGYNLLTKEDDFNGISKNYLINDIETRMKLLNGILEYSNKNDKNKSNVIMVENVQIMKDIEFLIFSLGYSCEIITLERTPVIYKIKFFDRTNGTITKINDIGIGDYVAIEIDGNKRFAINNFTITHNCANIFAKKFIVETVDSDRKKKYIQEFSENMSIKSKPVITNCKNESYVKITYYPDYKRFGMDGLDDDVVALLKKRVYDIAACTDKKVKVYLNDELLDIRTFKDFILMHYNEKPVLIYNEFKKSDVCRWKIGVVFSVNNGDKNVSFVNGIWTYQGGTHVDYIMNQIVDKVKEHIMKKEKKLTVKPAQIREHLTLFVDSVIDDPSFTSQTKGELTTKKSNFGTTCELDKDFITKLTECGLIDEVIKNAQFKEQTSLSKTDGKKINSLRNIPKLEDAHWAGKGKKSEETRLILTEGDSAKSYAISGLQVIGRERFGVFALRGKVVNVRKSNPEKINKNEEFINLKKILGLKQGVVYNDVSKLRYGGIIILTDQDSVVKDTPILLRDGNKHMLKKICDITNNWNIIDGKEKNIFINYDVWTDNGWSPIREIIRHKVNKKIYRIVSEQGIIDVTEDHSLLDLDGNEIQPSNCIKGMELLNSYIEPINVNNKKKSEQTIFEYLHDGYLCRHGHKDFNNDMINYTYGQTKSFLEGFYNENDYGCYSTDNKLTCQYLYHMHNMIGDYVKISVINDKYSIVKTNKKITTNKIIDIIDLGITDDYVYDLETENHHFQAGIGKMIVHNTDGSHIKGLLINMFQYFWPELLLIDGFIQTMSTPLIKVFKKGTKKNDHPLVFYTMSDFEKWSEEEKKDKKESLSKKYDIRYYKGLGTSDEKEAVEVFNEFEKRIVNFIWDTIETPHDTKRDIKHDTKNNIIKDSKSLHYIDLAFNEDKADDRKKWLATYDKNRILEFTKQNITYSEFFNKDLIHFSNDNNIRMIPSIMDGFKPSQRKIIYACFMKNLTTRIKVAQLASYVSEHTAYKHGEQSLQEAIISMAQNYPGSNNINLLYPSGTFGSRKVKGEDHAAPRYIFTYLEPIIYKIFRKEDQCILNYIIDEGEVIEPDYYLPIIPIVLINGANGIGTGYSTYIPPYNPIDICNTLIKLINDENIDDIEIIPWFRGFTGTIEKYINGSGKDIKGKYKTKGKYEWSNNRSLIITELPIGVKCKCIDDYKIFLESLISDKSATEKKKLTNVISNCGLNKVHFEIEFDEGELKKIIKSNNKGKAEMEKYLKLSSTITTSNMYLYNHKGFITKYNTVNDILYEFFDHRLKMYEVRKKYYLKVLENELKLLKYKIKFIQDILDKKIIIERQKRDDIIKRLEELKYPKLAYKYKDDLEETDKTYDYLTNMYLFSLTSEKIKELNNEKDKKQQEYDEYNSITERELWKRELNEFIEMYKKWYDESQEKLFNDNEIKPKKKQTRKKK